MSTADITGDVFACIPEWLLYENVSNRAIRLYAILYMKVFREDTRVARVTHQGLGQELGCSVSTLKEAVTELKEKGALVSWRVDGYDGNMYRIQPNKPSQIADPPATPQPEHRLPPSRPVGYNSITKEIKKEEGEILVSQLGFSDVYITKEDAKKIWDEFDQKRWFTSPWDGFSSIRRKAPSDFGIPDLREEEV